MHTLPQLTFPVFSPAFASLAGVLIASVWQGVLLTAAVAVGLRFVPGLTAAVRAALWTAVLLFVIALTLLPLTTPAGANAGPGLWHLGETISVALVAVWFMVSLFRLVQLAGSAVRLHGIVRRATPAEVPPAVTKLLNAGSRRVRIGLSAEVDRPSVAGFVRPRILLPPALLAELDEAELRQIVLHETEHLRRYDDWVNLLQQVSLALFPLNPALFWLNRRLARERELACDDGVLRATGARKAYAACLARVAEHTLLGQGVSLALGLVGNWFGSNGEKPELTRRVERILRSPVPPMGRTPERCATACLFAGLLGGASLLAHSPQLVSFTPAAPALVAHLAPTEFPGTGMLPVAATTGARPMLVKAVMSLPSRNPPMWPAAQPERRLRARLKGRHVRRSNAPAIHLAAWQPDPGAQGSVEQAMQGQGESLPVSTPDLQGTMPARLTPVLFRLSPGTQGWVAAVPVQGGWLVLQL